MKTMTTINSNRNQSTPILWTPLPECQQELLSGGSPRVLRSSPLPVRPGAPGAPSGYSADPVPATT
jgi:hypothetical protein